MSFSRRSSGGVSSSYDGSLGNLTPFITHSDPLDSKYLSRSMLEITRDLCYKGASKRNSEMEEVLGKEFNYVQRGDKSSTRSSNEQINYNKKECFSGDIRNFKVEDTSNNSTSMSRRRFSISYVNNNPSSNESEKQIKNQRDRISITGGDRTCPNYLLNKRSSSQLKDDAYTRNFANCSKTQLNNKKMNVYQANQMLCSLLERDPCRLNSSGLYSYNSRDHSYKINTFQDGCRNWYSSNNKELIDPFSDANNSYIPQYTTNARRAMYELIGTSELTMPDPDLSDNDLSLRFVRGTLVVCDLQNKLQLNLVPPIFGKFKSIFFNINLLLNCLLQDIYIKNQIVISVFHQ
ncbi:hypothetical protein FG386_000889 [Cryptosporidium ryanae]|uniref:uncharacterized protein n=1 Tax=Cryptosporidium ryanae TaxID=515981 RepID=UPI00351A1793|nr:hypothetical protein FG386_000889 [Cryptosporidium ryanae]